MFDHRIVSPSRMKWVGKKRPDGCLFCRIAKDDPDVDKFVIHRDKEVMVLMNIYPYNTGHVQVVPVKHVESLEDLSEKEITKLFVMVEKTMKLLRKVLKPMGFNIGINIGLNAGASISHLHVHIVPRFRTDFGYIEIIGKTKIFPESVEKTFEKIMKEARMLI